MIKIRPEHPADGAAIYAVHEAAFPTDAEARLVDALCAQGKVAVSLAAELEGHIIGHVLFSPVSIESNPNHITGVGLAPFAVLPDYQRRGIGHRLVEAGIDACRRAGFGFIVVLGEPAYYRRFGFRRALTYGLSNTYGADEEFMALALQPDALAGAHGLVQYAAEFSLL